MDLDQIDIKIPAAQTAGNSDTNELPTIRAKSSQLHANTLSNNNSDEQLGAHSQMEKRRTKEVLSFSCNTIFVAEPNVASLSHQRRHFDLI